MNILFAIMLFRIKNLSEPIDKMMRNVNSLMDSENYLM